VLLGAEGAALLLAATVAYFRLDYVWWLFLLLLFAPDLSFAGFLAGPRAGSIAYNAAHTMIGPILLLLGAWWAAWPTGIALALIWLAHLGLDRAVGYGLRYPRAPQSSHLDRV